MNRETITVIIPCYRSEQYLERTVEEIRDVLSRSFDGFLIVLVNDASPDGTYDVIRRLAKRFPGEAAGIDLCENVGQARAKMAGLRLAGSGPVVFMDDDGQHDPSVIPRLLKAVDRGYDLVYAQFPALMESLPRRAASTALDFLLVLFAGKPRRLRITSFFALSPAAVTDLRSMRTLHPFIGGRLMSRHFRVTGIAAGHRPRETDHSGYTLKKLFLRAFELCFLFRIPLKKGDPPMYRIRSVTGCLKGR